MRYHYTVSVETDTQEQANQVMAERLGYDEDYGFDYTITYLNDARLDRVVKGELYEYLGAPDAPLEIRHIRVKRVARDASWADIQVTQPATGSTWSKRQPLIGGQFAFHTRLIGSI
jgi:hypothetical protein